MSVPHERAGRKRVHKALLTGLGVLVVVGLVSAWLFSMDHRASNQASPIKHALGVYGLRSPQGAERANQSLGATIAVGNPDRIASSRRQQSPVKIIDSTPQKMLYRAMCPNGPRSCHHLSSNQMTRIKQRIVASVQKNIDNPAVLGYYLLDDYWFDMSAELKVISQAIKRIKPRATLLCAFGLNIATSEESTSVDRFRNKLVNYSPQWCNAVSIYSYSRSYSYPLRSSSDWSMSSTLELALHDLRNRGWRPTNGLLVGTPQAFNFNPRINRSTNARELEYRAVTTQQTLRTQVTAFCRAGAQAIIAYTWENGSPGRVAVLSNDPGLRKGLRQGMRNCQAIWLKQMARPLADHI